MYIAGLYHPQGPLFRSFLEGVQRPSMFGSQDQPQLSKIDYFSDSLPATIKNVYIYSSKNLFVVLFFFLLIVLPTVHNSSFCLFFDPLYIIPVQDTLLIGLVAQLRSSNYLSGKCKPTS